MKDDKNWKCKETKEEKEGQRGQMKEKSKIFREQMCWGDIM